MLNAQSPSSALAMSQDAAALLEGLTTDLQATQADLEAAFAEVRRNGLTDEENKALLLIFCGLTPWIRSMAGINCGFRGSWDG